jgi:hypothetical protein
MATIEHERTHPVDLDELEALWRTPAAAQDRVEPSLVERLPLNRVLVWGWVAFMVSVLFFEPAPNPQVQEPAWAVAVSTAFLGVLLAGAVLAKLAFTRLALGASVVAGGFGLALAIACKTTHHHMAGWWAYELLGSGLLLGLGVVCLARATGRLD